MQSINNQNRRGHTHAPRRAVIIITTHFLNVIHSLVPHILGPYSAQGLHLGGQVRWGASEGAGCASFRPLDLDLQEEEKGKEEEQEQEEEEEEGEEGGEENDLAQVVEREPQGKAQTRKAQLLKSTLCSDFRQQICYDTDL